MALQSTFLPDGKRLHLHHGPIDLIIEAFGTDIEVSNAYKQANVRFQTILEELVVELSHLRRSNCAKHNFKSSVAQIMQKEIIPYSNQFVTPMAAVAGAVAQYVLQAMIKGRRLEKAYVNNGGDVALYLNHKAIFDVGVVTQTTPAKLAGKITLKSKDAVGGIATSGWAGRSHSLGIADAVSVLAETAAKADVAATMIANQININSPSIKRAFATDIDPDSDLGGLEVTVCVGELSKDEINKALNRGKIYASKLMAQGLIKAASLCLKDELYMVGEKNLSCALKKDELCYV